MKQRPDPRKSGFFARQATKAARAVLAVTLLLTLIAGSIAWPVAASGPLCAMACCAGKAPHAAGSCMHGACETNGSIETGARNSSQHSHHNHEQQTQGLDSDNDSTKILVGVTGGACGADMEQVPTIEATPYQAVADENTLTVTRETETNHPALAVTVLSQPCQPGCGACTSGFATPNRSRNGVVLAGSKKALPSSSSRLGDGSQRVTYMASVYCRQSLPRGPPSSFS
ncbi:MAG: hypothetical protein ACREA9_26120 [Pyrinomonadaceae bacterium]